MFPLRRNLSLLLGLLIGVGVGRFGSVLLYYGSVFWFLVLKIFGPKLNRFITVWFVFCNTVRFIRSVLYGLLKFC